MRQPQTSYARKARGFTSNDEPGLQAKMARPALSRRVRGKGKLKLESFDKLSMKEKAMTRDLGLEREKCFKWKLRFWWKIGGRKAPS